MEAQIAEAVRQVQHRFGSAALRQGRDGLSEAAWPTGVLAFDHRLTGGGLPLGRISVLSAGGGAGGAPSGRLTLLQLLAASASRRAQVVYVDLTGMPAERIGRASDRIGTPVERTRMAAERARPPVESSGTLDPGFLADLGADLDACLVVRPRHGDPVTGLVMARALVAAGVPWLAVGMGGERPRAGGQRWDHAISTLVEAAWRSRGVVCVSATAPLDRALAYASSLTLTCTARGWHWVHGDIAGLRVEITATKSKLSPPGATETLLLRYPRPFAAAGAVSVPGIIEAPAAASVAPTVLPVAPAASRQVAPAAVPALAATG